MTIVLIYVDNIIFIGGVSAYLKELVDVLNNSFPLKELGDLSFFPGIEIQSNDDVLYKNQYKYIVDLLLKHGLDSTKLVFTILTSGAPLSKFDNNVLLDAIQFR